ncbi:MAG: hypothetical protein L0229_32305 [Blastocatellia bacterium]|nr:hypothetical protein [Blastocatellia bacterium]
MTGEEMERAIEFLLEHHAKFSADIDILKEVQAQASRDVSALASVVSELADTVARVETQMVEGFARVEAQAEAMRQEMRENFDNLILANEITRKLAADVANLAVQTARRVTDLESKLP